jgi:Putative lumazine-binding
VPASRTLALLLAAAGLATGCGASGSDSASDFSGVKKDVANAVEDLESAARSSDETKICRDLLTSSLIDALRTASRRSCDSAISDALDDADTFNLTVKSVTVAGTTATVVVDSKEKDSDDTFRLAKVGGRWKIASLGGS